MKKGILIVVAIILMILAIIPIIDYYCMKNYVYGKGQIQNAEQYFEIKNDIIAEQNYNPEFTLKTFFRYFQHEYNPNGNTSFVWGAFYRLFEIDENGLTLFEPDTAYALDYICYVTDLFLVWFVLFAILQVPIFTMRLMGLDKNKGGKKL